MIDSKFNELLTSEGHFLARTCWSKWRTPGMSQIPMSGGGTVRELLKPVFAKAAPGFREVRHTLVTP